MSLVEQVLTPELRARLSTLKTSNGVTFKDITRSGVENPDSKIGLYALDRESYQVFGGVFDPVIELYHGFGPDQKHVSSFDISERDVDNVDPEGKYIISTRIRVARNILGYPFPGAITLAQRLKQESELAAFLVSLPGDLSGNYESLKTMTKERSEELDKAHLLFQQEQDPYLDSAGITSNFPEGRGMFLCEGNTAGVWGQEEDGLRIWVLEKGSDFRRIFGRLTRLSKELEDHFGFAKSERYGYLTSCPTNVGTGMRASVMIKLPHLGKDEDKFKAICADMKLAVRGMAGEHSKSEGGIFDISNKARLGLSEADIVELVAQGAKKLIAMEQIQEQKAA